MNSIATASQTRENTNIYTLRNCPLNLDVTISTITLDERHRFRLLELGLRAGTVVRVIQKSNFGGRVVAKGNERIALDGQTAQSIQVTVNTHPSTSAML